MNYINIEKIITDKDQISSELKTAIIDRLNDWKSKTNEKTWIELAELSDDGLALCHFGLGLFIRNNYIHNDEDFANLFTGTIWRFHHDSMSSIMLEIWRDELRKQHNLTKKGIKNE